MYGSCMVQVQSMYSPCTVQIKCWYSSIRFLCTCYDDDNDSNNNSATVEEVCDAPSLLNKPILSQLTQDHTDYSGGFVPKKSDPLVPDDSTVATAALNIFSSTSPHVQNKISSNSIHIPAVNHTENNVLSNTVRPPDNNAYGEANMNQRCGDLDVLQYDTSGPDRQRMEEVRDVPFLLNKPILSQLSQEHTDDGGGFV